MLHACLGSLLPDAKISAAQGELPALLLFGQKVAHVIARAQLHRHAASEHNGSGRCVPFCTIGFLENKQWSGLKGGQTGKGNSDFHP